MRADDPPVISPALALVLTQALARGGARVEVLEVAGERGWLKRVEVLRGVMRWQKGDPVAALAAETTGLRLLGRLGLPVVPLLADGPDWFLTRDCGPTVDSLLRAEGQDAAGVGRVMRAAGGALGLLHKAGYAHGRPVLRDICWDGARARFIDLERFRTAPAGPWRQALDMAILVQSWFARFPQAVAGMDVAAAAWAAQVGPVVCRRVVVLGWVLGWSAVLAAPVCWLKPGAREFRALPLTLRYLRRFQGAVGQQQA